jgi:hypothetical protein
MFFAVDAREQLGNASGRLCLHAGQHMRVLAERERRGFVAEALAYDFHADLSTGPLARALNP